jgi:hypothetical protein
MKEKEDSKAENINEEKNDNPNNINVGNEKVINLEVNKGEAEKQTVEKDKKEDIEIGLGNKKPGGVEERKKNNIISDFDDKVEEVSSFTDGEPDNTLKKGERVVGAWKF